MSKYTQSEKAQITINKGKEAIPAITKTLGCLVNKDLKAYITKEQENQIRDSIKLLESILDTLEDDLLYDELKTIE